jgi:hypothetical protein
MNEPWIFWSFTYNAETRNWRFVNARTGKTFFRKGWRFRDATSFVDYLNSRGV